jgi:hypothetical protein
MDEISGFGAENSGTSFALFHAKHFEDFLTPFSFTK